MWISMKIFIARLFYSRKISEIPGIRELEWNPSKYLHSKHPNVWLNFHELKESRENKIQKRLSIRDLAKLYDTCAHKRFYIRFSACDSECQVRANNPTVFIMFDHFDVFVSRRNFISINKPFEFSIEWRRRCRMCRTFQSYSCALH
jgi:hypothetical protein